MIKQILLFLASMMLVSSLALAEEDALEEPGGFEAAEAHRSTIRINVDGTGVITRIACEICDFTVVNITKNSAAYVGGKPMTPAEALQKSKGKVAMVKFTLDTKEVLELRFYN